MEWGLAPSWSRRKPARAMSFYGDLSSIGLSDLLQNLEQAQRTGTLTVSAGGDETQIYLRQGRVSMLASPGRSLLMESLVRQSVITARQFESARTRRKGSRKSLGETLESLGVLTAEQMRQYSEGLLTEDLCTLLVCAEGSFRFREGDPPARVFDPEERRLNLQLPMNPVLIEAARRKDHWELVRRVIPTDSMHFVAHDRSRIPDEIEHPEVAKQILANLDGTRSVDEVVQGFGPHSFLAHCVLAQLVRDRLVRSVDSEDLAKSALDLREADPERALQLVRRARETEARNPQLLSLEAELCETIGDNGGAATATKILAHIHLEKGDSESGRSLLEKAVTLDPDDTALWEKTLGLAIDDDRIDDAIREGLALVELYRAPGLHSRATEVLSRLREVRPESIDLQLEWAKSLTMAGDSKTAVAELLRVGKSLVSHEAYVEAERVFSGALDIEPGNEQARKLRDKIESNQIKDRRERNRSIRRRLRSAVMTACFLTLLFFELWARLDVAEATSQISADRLIEQRRYEEAKSRLQTIADRYWFTPTRYLELRNQLSILNERISEQRR